MLLPRDKSGYFSTDTIAAIATEVGGAISIVRVSGDLAFSTLKGMTQSGPEKSPEPRKLYRCSLVQASGEPLDDALLCASSNPTVIPVKT